MDESRTDPKGGFKKTLVYKVHSDGLIEFSGRIDDAIYTGRVYLDKPEKIEILGELSAQQRLGLESYLSKVINSL